MKYSRTALGLLNAQYRSVLRKCFLINMGLFALGAIAATPAKADSTVTTATELVDAVKAADTAGNTTTTITLGKAISDGDGLFLTQNKKNDITLYLNDKSLNIDGPAVGSTGTENQGIHAEKNNKLTIKDGNISFNKSSGIKMGIQNYSDLTLDNVNIDGNGVSGKYVLSNNNGTTTIKNSTITAKVGGVAFDVCDATGVGYSGTTVNLIDSTIKGAIELANWGTPVGQSTENAVLNVSGNNNVTGDINNELGSVNLTNGTLTLDGSITGNGELNIDSAATLAMKGANAVISQKSVENNGKINVLAGKTTLKSTVTGTGTMSAEAGATLDTSQADIEQSEIDLKGATVENNMFSAIGNLKADEYVVDDATTTNLTALGTGTAGKYNVLSANGAKNIVLGDTGTKVYLGTNAEGNEIATQKYVADNAVQTVAKGTANGTISVDGGADVLIYDDTTISGKVTALETTVGDSTSGLVKAVADNATAIAGKLSGKEAADYTISGKRGSALAENIATYVAANGTKFADVQNTANIITDLFNDKAAYIQETTGMDPEHGVAYNYNQSSEELLHGATSMLNADEKLAGAIAKRKVTVDATTGIASITDGTTTANVYTKEAAEKLSLQKNKSGLIIPWVLFPLMLMPLKNSMPVQTTWQMLQL